MKKKKWMLWTATALVLAGLLLIGGAVFLPLNGEEEIYSTVLRLHILANSDEEEDQKLKLTVRDAVLAYSTQCLDGVGNREEAAKRLEAQLPALKAVAEACVSAEGYTYPVYVTLGTENYPTRNYETCCFPAGEYLSLQVIIGAGTGHNWWCVLFPPCCRAAASVSRKEVEEEFVAVGLTREQYSIITETENTKYRIRFKLLEAIEKWLH